jgi:hypothetical protein
MAKVGVRVGSYDVENAVATQLRDRLPIYLAAATRRHGVNPAQTGFARMLTPRVDVHKDFEGWPEQNLPHIRVVSPGMSQAPIRSIRGSYTTFWTINVFGVVSARDLPSTRRLRSIFEYAVPWTLLQQPSLGGVATNIVWLGESAGNVPIPPVDDRTLQGFVQVFDIEIDNCLQPNEAPLAAEFSQPPLTVLGDWPTVSSVVLNLTPLPVVPTNP